MTRAFQLSLVLLLLAFIGAGRAASLPSSDFLVTTWRSEEGLPHSGVNDVVQTQDGYLWIGTYVGLVRFDGARFVHFSINEVPELGDGRVAKLFEDRDGTLWVGLETGRLLAWKDGIARIHLPGGTNPPVVAMAQDASGVIWVQTANGRLGRLTAAGMEEVAAPKTPAPRRESLGVVVDSEDTLWVGTPEGLRVWRQGQLAIPPGLPALTSQAVEALAPGLEGALWVTRDARLWQIRSGTIVAERAGPPQLNSSAVAVLEAADHRLWLAAADGTLFYLGPSGSWQAVPMDQGLRGTTRSLCADREGNLWRGSFGGGLTRLRPRLFALYESPARDFDQYALSVCADGAGHAWALLNGRTLARVSAETQTLQVWSGAPLPQGLRALCFTRAGALWAGTSGWLYRLDQERLQTEFKFGSETVNALFEDAQSNLWVGLSQGVGVGVLPHGDPKRWQAVAGVPFADVRSIAQAADGAMWFGTHYGGVCRLQEGRWSRFTLRDGLPSDYVRCLLADPDGTLWLGTMRGLCRWRKGRFTPIRSQDGLWNDTISWIIDDGQGRFWMSSFGGVFRVERRELNAFCEGQRASIQCVGYDRSDGLPSQECPGGFQPAGTRTTDGQLWFPTVDGLVSIAPERIQANELPPPVRVEEVLIDGTRHLVQPANLFLEASPGKRRFEFNFTALSLTAPAKVRFRHQLEGLDADWSQPDSRRSVTYSFIPPGRYVFRVTACNNDGVWNAEGASLQLVVRPFFWQTWWFKTSLGLLLAGALAWSVRRIERWKARRRLERLEQQHALERERARIAKDIHDDLGASLTQIALLSERVDGVRSDPAEVARWNQRISAAARRTIQSLDEIVWAVSPKHDTLESLANYLSQFTQEHLALAGIRCLLEVPTVLPPVDLSAEVRHNLLLATREALQNVVAHAGATEVRVALQLGEEALEITVADNGRGCQPHTGEGHGLLNMRRRLEEIGGRFELVTQPNQGTTVRFWLARNRLHVRGIGKPGRSR